MKITTIPVGFLGTNCYLLCDEDAKVCAVIDPGAEASKILSAIRSSGCTPAVILLTHGHDDHVGAVEALVEAFPSLPVYLSDKDVYEDASAWELFPHLTCPLRSYDEGDTVAVGGLTVSVLATPGHSEGSVTLRCGDALFCGDTLFAGSCGRTDFLDGSMPKMLASLRRLDALEGNFKVLPGHMDSSDLDRERQSNPYLLHAKQGC